MTYDPDNDHENSTLQEIFDAYREKDRAAREVVDLKEKLKEAKDILQDATDRCDSLVRHADQRRLPMGGAA